MSEWLKETGCKPVGLAYAGSNPAPPIALVAREWEASRVKTPSPWSRRLSLATVVVAVLAAPAGVAQATSGSAYVPDDLVSGDVLQFDVGLGGGLSPKNPASAPGGTNPDAIAITPDGRNAYVTNFDGSDVSQFDIAPGGL